MLRTLALAAAAFALLAGAADAQKIDRNGRCHDAKGRFAKMEVCQGAPSSAPAAKSTSTAKPAATAKPTTTASAAGAAPAATYKLDAKGKCRDAKGRMAKKDLCKA
jgi:hypothetical protein